MKNRKNILKKVLENYKWRTILQVIIAGAVILLIMLIRWYPGNPYVIFGIFFVSGMMNIINGFAIHKNRKRRNQGMSMIMLGSLLLFLGVFLLQMLL